MLNTGNTPWFWRHFVLQGHNLKINMELKLTDKTLKRILLLGSGLMLGYCFYTGYRIWKKRQFKSIDEGFEDVSKVSYLFINFSILTWLCCKYIFIFIFGFDLVINLKRLKALSKYPDKNFFFAVFISLGNKNWNGRTNSQSWWKFNIFFNKKKKI